MMMDTDFVFRDFFHNIPRDTKSIQDSQRSSFIEDSSLGTIIFEEYDDEIEGDLLSAWNA